ncbi:MAG: hypothetical protein QM767_16640 [Anaeromyxobacter sp.]
MKHTSDSHEARKALFQRGIREGHLTVDEIDRSLPQGSLSAAERWLLFYSLRAAGVEIRDGQDRPVEDHAREEDAPGPDA